MNDSEKRKIVKALLKKALGYSVDEISEEYSADENGKLVLSKKKITSKHIPADMAAVKVLLDEFLGEDDVDYSSFSDEQLKKERDRLLQELRKMDEELADEI